MVRALMLAYWFPPENESGALRPHRFYRLLPGTGVGVRVVAAALGQGQETDPQVLRTPVPAPLGWRAVVLRIIQRIAPYNDQLEWVPVAARAARSLWCEQPYDVVISTSPPLATHLVAALLKLKYGVVWIADFRDPLRGNPFRTLLRGRLYDWILEAAIVRLADVVILNTDGATDACRQRHPRYAGKMHLIWNGYDPSDEPAASLPGNPELYRIVHLGSLYGGRHPGILVGALARLVATGKIDPARTRLELIGTYEPGSQWMAADSWRQLDAHGMLEYQNEMRPRPVAQQAMATADCLLLLDINETGAGVQVPGKLFEYIRVGRPILAVTNKGSAVERILARAGVPYTCVFADEGEAEVEAKLLAHLAYETTPMQASEWFRQTFDATVQTRTLAELALGALKARRP